MLQSLLLGWRPSLFQSVWPNKLTDHGYHQFPEPVFGSSLLYSPSPPITELIVEHERTPYSVEPFSITTLSRNDDSIIYNTLRHMQALLPEDCAYLQPNVFRGFTPSFTLDGPHVQRKQAIIDSFKPTGVRVDTFESHLIRAWVEQRRTDLKIELSALWTRCPSLRHFVHFTHPSTRAFYWIADRDSGGSDARVRFHAYVDQQTRIVMDFGGHPSFSVGEWLEKWWLEERGRSHHEVVSL